MRAASEFADVSLVCFTDGEAAKAPIQPLLDVCSRVEVVSLPPWQSRMNMLANLPGRLPFQVAHYRSAVMERLAVRLNREGFDIAFAQMFRMRPYLDLMSRSRKILDLGDSLALNLRRAAAIKPLYARPAFLEEYRRVERYERESLERVEESWVLAETDKQDFLRRSPGARIRVVPNGIELKWGAAGLSGPKEDAAIFLGNLTVGHNVDCAIYLAREIWPIVRSRKPAAVLHLVGKPGPAVARLAELPGVQVEGFVANLTPILSRSRMALAPLRYGAGVQNKVLETMAAGLPAVVTPLVNDPIAGTPGRDIVVATSRQDVAEAIVHLFDSPDEAQRIGGAGRGYVMARYSWAKASERFRELLG
jgi:glycosyltransferase involved in cell wall biosynthesis